MSNDELKKKKDQTEDINSKESKKGENYGFIKEEFAPTRKWSKGKKRMSIVLMVFLLAILFGAIARVSYTLSDYFLTTLMEDDDRSHVDLNASPTEAAGVGENPNTTPIVVDSTAFEQYDALVKGVRETAESLNPCLVTVTTVHEVKDEVFESVSEITKDFGGVILADNDVEFLVLAVYSQISGADVDSYRVTFNNGVMGDAFIMSTDTTLDLCILSVSHKNFTAENYNGISVIAKGDSSGITEGSTVIAIGCPNGRIGSVNFGMVQSAGEMYYITDNSVAMIRTSMFGTDKSSGVLLDTKGELVGIITNQFATEGNNLLSAYSINEMLTILNNMVNDQPHVYFGASMSDLSDAALAQIKLSNGILITEVIEDSPAYEEEFRRGDILTEVAGNRIYYVSQFATIMSGFSENDRIPVTFCRNGKQMQRTIKIQLSE